MKKSSDAKTVFNLGGHDKRNEVRGILCRNEHEGTQCWHMRNRGCAFFHVWYNPDGQPIDHSGYTWNRFNQSFDEV